MHLCTQLLLAVSLLFTGSPLPGGGSGTGVGKVGTGGSYAGGGASGPGASLGGGGSPGVPAQEQTASGPGIPDTVADFSYNEVDEITGGTLVYEGPQGSILEGPFTVTLPGQPPITTPPSYLLVTLNTTPTGVSETFIVQQPKTLVKGTQVPLLVAFHKCCNTMFDITVNTSFSRDSRARGWFMMAPLGAATANFSSIPSQLNTELALDVLLMRYGDFIDRRRIYGVGFSMGGGNALNYAARHVDTTKPMFAALVNHTGGLDLTDTYLNDTGARPTLQFWFGGRPGLQPFNYRRSSVVVADGSPSGYSNEASLGRNITHVPILDVRAQFDAPATQYLLGQNELFETMFTAYGGFVQVEVKAGISQHLWSTLEEAEALNFLEQFRLELPTQGSTVADRNDRFFYFDIVQDASNLFTPFDWQISTRANQFTLSATANLSEIRFHLLEAGLSLKETLTISLDTTDNLADTVLLEGFGEPPVEVLRDGLVTAAWAHDGPAKMLRLLETDGSANHVWRITSAEAAADVRVGVFVDETAPLENTNVDITVVVRNFGPSIATGVRIDDLLPAGLSFDSATPDQGSYNSGTGEWDLGTLGVGGLLTMGLVATVDVGTGGDLIVNAAGLGSVTQIDPLASNDTGSVSLTVDNNADLQVVKSVDNDRPKPGEQVVYTVQVTNLAPGAQASTLTIGDLLPSGVTYLSDVPSHGSYDDGLGVWSLGTLNSGATATLNITASIDAGTLEQTIVNTASVLSFDQNDPNATNDTDSASLLVVDDVDLAVTKLVDNAVPHELDQIVYTITVTNTSGSVNASSVELTDLLPAGLSFVSDNPSQGSYSSGTGLWQVGALAAGTFATLGLTVQVDVGTGGSSIVNATGAVVADQPDPNALNDSDSVQVDVDADADLTVTKLVDDAAPIEQDTIVYTISISNPVGAAEATNVSLTDLLPAGVSFVSDVPSQGSYVSGSGLWTIGTLKAGSSATLDITCTVDIGSAGLAIVNSAAGLLSDQPDSNAGDNSDTAQIDVSNLADLSVTKTVDNDFPRVAESVVYTITINNPSGGAQATTVSLTDLLPAGLTHVSDIPSQGSYASGSGVWTVGTLASGAMATLGITASVDAGTVGSMIVNTASALSFDQTDPNLGNNSDTASLLVIDDVDLSVTKTVDVATPMELFTIVYTITVTNASATVAASSVALTDLLPAGVTYVSDLASQGSYDDMTGLWTVGAIAASSNVTLDITVTVDVATGGTSIVNQTFGLGADQPDPNGVNDSDSVQIDVDNGSDLAVSKTVDNATPSEQDSVVYTITVSNPIGAAQATGVSLTDSLPAGVTYVSDLASQGSFDDLTGIWTVGTIAAGSNATLDITVSVDIATGGDAIVNTTSALTLDQTDANATNDVGTIQIDVDSDADLSVTKIVDDATPAEQATVIYTVTIANPVGAAQATTVTLSDLLPAGVTFVSNTPSQGSYNDLTGLWTVGTIEAGASATLDITATVDEGAGGGLIVNTASGLSADQPDSNALNNLDTADITVSNDADLSVTKVVDDATPLESGTVVYTITVANPIGAARATTVSLTDLLPAGVSYVSDLPGPGSYVSGSGLWTVGTLDAGANATLAITATVDVGTGGQAVVNTTSGLTLDQNDPNALNNLGSAQIDIENEADLSVTKVVDDATPLEQGTVVYTITLENTAGGARATNVTLTDLLPAGVTYVSDIPSQGSYLSGSGLWTVGTLDTGVSATLAITATVDAGTGGDLIVNTASSPAHDQTDSNALNDSDQASITVDDNADLSVSKTVDDATPREGETVVYTITITNPGGGAQATTVSLTDSLPAGVTYASDVPSQGSFASGTGIWTVGTIAAGASATLDISVTVDAATSGTAIVNTTSGLSLDQIDANAANDTDSAQIDVEPNVDLAVMKTADDLTPAEQATVIYTITISNGSGTDSATSVALTDLLPAGVTYVSHVASQGSYNDSSGLWTVGTIAAVGNATLDITVTVDVATGGDAIVNTTSALSFDQFDSNVANDVGSVQIDVENNADLAVIKVVDDATPRVGDTVIYTITVSSPGGGAQATGVSLTDALPSGVTFVSDSPSQGSFASGSGIWTVGTLNAGANATLALTVTVDAAQEGNQIVNTTSALVLDQTDSNAIDDTGSIAIDVEADVDLSVSKTVDNATPSELDTIVYTITITNNDATDGASGISVTDLLPVGVTYVLDSPSQGSFASGTGIWSVGSIAALGNATLGITVTVDGGTSASTITNTTSGLALDQSDSNSSNDIGSVGITVN